MFGPYEITCEGRTYHANVTLKEHHLVERGGEHILFVVQEMTALPLDRTLAEAILRLLPGPGTLVPDALWQALRGCGVAAGDETRTDAAVRADASASPARPVAGMALFLTQTCNLRCVYCYGEGGEYGGRGVMNAETARAAVDWLLESAGDAGRIHIGFFGGEPLLELPLLRGVVAYAKQQATTRGKEVTFGMTTNGTLLTRDAVAFLAEEQVDTLISFDGPPAVHDRQRPFRNGRGSCDRILTNVRRMRRDIPHTTARATVYGDGDPFAIRRGTEEAGFDRCILLPASPVLLRGEEPAGASAARRRATARMLAYHRQEVARLFRAFAERTLDPARPPADLTLVAGLADGRKRHTACGIGRGLRAVSVDGDVYPCHRFVGLEGARLGHVREPETGELNDYHRAVVENLPLCRNCWARYFCGGGCFYENQAYTGDMHRPDPLFCHEVKTVCEDVIYGWCRLSDADKAYVRALVGELGSPREASSGVRLPARAHHLSPLAKRAVKTLLANSGS